MSQNDFTIANQGFPAFRADLNSALQALASNSSGATAPSTTFANMWWYDSANNIMYIRNEDNDAWIKFAELDQTNDKFVLSGTLQLDDGTVSAPALTFNSDTNMGIYRGGTDILKFVTAGTDAITIDASQNVDVNGTLTSDGLTVDGDVTLNDGSPNLRLQDSDVSRYVDILYGTRVATFRNTMASGEDIDTVEPSMVFSFQDDGETRTAMTINHDGNLLVGTTDDNPSNDTSGSGIALRSDGIVALAASNTTPLRANRTGNDGEIVSLRRDGTERGVLGVTSTDRLYIGGGANNGIGIDAHLFPTTDAGILSDGDMNLGASNARWQDLYVSGGVAFDTGTAANYLDDYEQATFTAYLRDAPSGGNFVALDSARYVKIGKVVNVWIKANDIDTTGLTSANQFFVTNLPFVSTNDGTEAVGSIWWQNLNISATGYVVPRIKGSVNYIRFDELVDATTDSGKVVSALTDDQADLMVTISYTIT